MVVLVVIPAEVFNQISQDSEAKEATLVKKIRKNSIDLFKYKFEQAYFVKLSCLTIQFSIKNICLYCNT